MPKTTKPMTRAQMQDEALVIESLLNTVLAMSAGDNAQDSMNLIEMAQDRARKLNLALDSINEVSA